MSDSAQLDEPPARADKTARLVVAVFVVLLLVAAVAALAFVLINWGSAGPSALRHPAVGQKLPRLELAPLTGEGVPSVGHPYASPNGRVSLADLSGRVVLLNFWGTWCPQCLVELPDMAQIERQFRARDDFMFLAVSCGQDLAEDLGQLRLETSTLLFIQHFDMPTYSDPGGVTRRAVDQVVGLELFPVTLVLDRGGVIRGVWVGPADKRELEELITRLLEEE